MIIPTYNEAQGITKTLNELQHRQSEQSLIHEIIIVDGKSDDGDE